MSPLVTMYDSVLPSAIPLDAQMVAGYADGRYAWSASDWHRFPRARLVRIATGAETLDAGVLDVESGDATPEQAPGWVHRRRTALRPDAPAIAVYTSLDLHPAVVTAFAAARVEPPSWWIADWDGAADLAGMPPGTVAKQFSSPTLPGRRGWFDLSVVDPAWAAAHPIA